MRPTGILFFPQRACETPTQLVQLLSRVWHRSELWLLHHANWCVCISMWTSRRWRVERGWCFQIGTHTHAGVYVQVLARVSDPVCCALACGYLEVSADVVSACGSGFTIFRLIETCIHLADSSLHSRRENFFSSSFYLFCLFTTNFFLEGGGIWTLEDAAYEYDKCSLSRCEIISFYHWLSFTFSLALHQGRGI